jgi:TonB-linked SusC/RagA family outer membrane protein
MKRLLLSCVAMALMLYSTQTMAQDRTVSGRVTSTEDGSPLPGVNVVVKGTTIGTATDADGKYSLAIPSSSLGGSLVFSFIGLKTQEIPIGDRSTIDISLSLDATQLSEIVVTGVGLATDVKKLSVSVAKINENLIQQVPASNAASALQGKIAGVRVTSNGGAPGSSPQIVLRGNTSMFGTQEPLIIIDGIISESSLADINAQDVESIEVVKGAAAASIYGSRAANGVVNIRTKRGSNLADGKTKVVVRNEYGKSYLPNYVPVNKSHLRVVPDGQTLDLSVHTTNKTDLITDVPYNSTGKFYNYQKEVFQPGDYYSNYVSVSGASSTTNYSVSAENFNQGGSIRESKGYDRQNIRLNIDNKSFNEKLSIGVSSFYSQSENDLISPGGNGGDGSILFDLLRLPPNADMFAKNANGQPYKWDLDPQSPNEANPLYDIWIQDITRLRRRTMNNVSVGFKFTDWLSAEGTYSMDNTSTDFKHFVPKTYIAGPASAAIRKGYFEMSNSENRASLTTGSLIGNKKFGDFSVNLKLSYWLEKEKYFESGFDGNNFRFEGLPDADIIDPTDTYPTNIDSGLTETIAESYFAVGTVSYLDKYIFDGLVRKEAVSLFGADERDAIFFRASAAWRITQDFDIPGVQELKLRASYGTAGNRPPVWNAQYEVYTAQGNKSVAGNPNLKREIATETEIGINVNFLEKFTFEANYSLVKLEDLIGNAPLVAPLGRGNNSWWTNLGAMKNTVIELSLGADVIKNNDMRWNVGVVFDRIRNKVTRLDGMPFLRTGPSPNNEDGKGMILVKEGGILGEIWGNVLMTSFDQLRATENPDDWTKNSHGYLVKKSEIGTVNEKPYQWFDASGNPVYAKIGDVNPDFNMGFNTTFTWKGLNVFALVEWKKGGDVYNQTKQWMYFQNRHGEQDMAGVAQIEKKSTNYYQVGIYNANNPTDYFVEDGSFVKLREVNISYNFPKGLLSKMGVDKVLSGLQLGIVGRNLLMFTGYTGYDPEVSRGNPDSRASNAANLYAYDGFTYPNLRNYSAYLTLTF